MTKRQKLYLVFDADGAFICGRYIERVAREACPPGGSVRYGYKPKGA